MLWFWCIPFSLADTHTLTHHKIERSLNITLPWFFFVSLSFSFGVCAAVPLAEFIICLVCEWRERNELWGKKNPLHYFRFYSSFVLFTPRLVRSLYLAFGLCRCATRCCLIVHRTVKLVIFMNGKQFPVTVGELSIFHDNIIYNK